MRAAVAAAVLMAVLASSEARAEFYKWVDRDGREFITNEQEKIPAEYRGSARPVDVRDDRVSVGRKPAVDRNRPAAAPDHKDRYGRGEQYWRMRSENLRRQLREQEDDLGLIAQQEKDDEGKLKKNAASAKKTRSARAKKRAAIERKIAKLTRELDVDLPEEARKADAYPGWLRE